MLLLGHRSTCYLCYSTVAIYLGLERLHTLEYHCLMLSIRLTLPIGKDYAGNARVLVHALTLPCAVAFRM